MKLEHEQWTRINTKVKLEAPHNIYRFNTVFVSPGGLFVPTTTHIDPRTQITVNFSIEGQSVVAQAEVRRVLSAQRARDRGIDIDQTGLEIRIIRIQGDGSQILADHIKKLMRESGLKF